MHDVVNPIYQSKIKKIKPYLFTILLLHLHYYINALLLMYNEMGINMIFCFLNIQVIILKHVKSTIFQKLSTILCFVFCAPTVWAKACSVWKIVWVVHRQKNGTSSFEGCKWLHGQHRQQNHHRRRQPQQRQETHHQKWKRNKKRRKKKS